MKQLLQHMRNGEIAVADVPAPAITPSMLLVRNRFSLVSAGTERTLLGFAEKNLIQKAASRPDLVRQLFDKARRDGVLSTLQAAWNRLDQPMAMGYSCAGSVIAVGENAGNYQAGDRVACCGFGYASHAEFVSVPHMLAAKLPAGASIDLEQAAFATVGAIALHGVRLSGAGLGDVVAVLGLGLIGQIVVQLLRAAGCQVAAMDPISWRARLAGEMGAVSATSAAELHSAVMRMTPHGADAVLIAAGSSDNAAVALAGELARDRASVVAVGAVGLNLPRKLYYEKELNFRISRSYGPGRYDPEYEERGHDYPIGYVRWTEGRNLQAFLDLLAAGKLDLRPVITHRFPITEAQKAYELISGKTKEPYLGVLITYPEDGRAPVNLVTISSNRLAHAGMRVGLLGAGAFATGTLVPAIKAAGAELVAVCARSGASSAHAARRFGFALATTNPDEILANPDVTLVAICTRHHLHAAQVVAALRAGKHVFCEKPLCMNREELGAIVRAYQAEERSALFVGYNRRFAPMTQRLKEFISKIREPLMLHYRVNAGYLSPTHWIQDPAEGGGRVIGEMCHFVDYLMFLAGSFPVRVEAAGLPDNGRYRGDNLIARIQFASGSLATIAYVANGSRAFSKERLEIFGGGAAASLEDFRTLELAGARRKIVRSRLVQDKGHRGEWLAIRKALEGNPLPIPFEELVASALAVFAIEEALKTGSAVEVNTAAFLASSSALPGPEETP